MKVLILDDISVQLNLLLRFVKKLFEIDEIRLAQNGRKGLDILESGFLPDLIITDYNMPVMNGVEFIEQVRKMEDYKKTPIIIVSAEQNEEVLSSVLDVGANHYITRPYTFEKFIQAVGESSKYN